jgi:hypothetical protein
MHFLKELSRVPGSHVLPGILVLILAIVTLCVWETRRLAGRQTGSGRDRLIALTGIVLGAASCIFMAARFIWVA